VILGHRRIHRLIVLFLAPVALGVFVAAVIDRASAPDASPAANLLRRTSVSVDRAIERGDVIWSREDLFVNWPARVIAYQFSGEVAERGPVPSSHRALEIKPLRPIGKPDVLLYWAPATEGASTQSPDGRALTSLPADAHLLGRIGGTGIRRFKLPGHGDWTASRASGGSLILYSLGHQEVIAAGGLPPLSGSEGVRP
jgi:hypothetical protein